VADDLAGQTLEVWARLDAELVHEEPASGFVGLESFRLTSGAIEGDHQPSDQLLAVRVLVDEPPKLADQLAVPPQREARVDVRLDHTEPKLVEMVSPPPANCSGTPARIGPRHSSRAAFALAAASSKLPVANAANASSASLEVRSIEACGAKVEAISTSAPLEEHAVGREFVPQPRHVRLQAVPRG
jgi:hypothetical protein